MILVVNAGSSSIKVALFQTGPDGALTQHLAGQVSGIGGPLAHLDLGTDDKDIAAPDHDTALAAILSSLAAQGVALSNLTAAAHRVVHGGTTLVAPCRVTDDVIAGIEAATPLAPLHNPNNLAAIRALQSLAPDLAQYASFGTAFHATNPDVATTYAIPAEDRAMGIRRYGFHGLSYAWIVTQFGADLPKRLLALHLGSGASLCAIKNGRSVATSMGYSPLDGLTMGTRSGAIDGMAVLRMAEIHGPDEAARRLNKDSGLKGLGGANDMRLLLAADTDKANFAVDHFCYWAARHAGSAVVAMGGLDAVAFTGGIGENSAKIRDRIMAHLAFLGDVPVHVVKAQEERQIALDALTLGAV
ncbi:acetate/propionate family kinase [Pseudooctadecabacter jejudonensis]|uniref:Acetate kinase n=1 Tax=Pseudooctadecabacter jejudonensis TaxID=1391910 RepID=A0A1Y5T9E9_9RHOB|nr:acetate kinase [Pseudooctadecabacter jejudonensis]SLN55309.1 Acetate kinase [Pseudooctadecabacter jejudonensis]